MENDSVLKLLWVMVVDDKRAIRQGIRALLSLMPGMELVGEAENGREAVNQVCELKPDVVLMDVHMPVMDGLEAARCIRNRWPEVRIIMLSMFSEYEEESIAAGACLFLVKGGPSEALRCAICHA
jgi:YesN/AraC family two-component response regulator